MSKNKIRQIKNINDIDNLNDDEIIYYLQYSEDMKDVMLGVRSAQPITPEEYVDIIANFVNEVSEHPQNLFVESVDHNEDAGLH